MKRKKPDTGAVLKPLTPKKRRTNKQVNGHTSGVERNESLALKHISASPQSKDQDEITQSSPRTDKRWINGAHDEGEEDSGSPTPRANGKPFLTTPKRSEKRGKRAAVTPSRAKRADRSAKRKSATTLLEQHDEEDWEGGRALAQDILDSEDDQLEGEQQDPADLREQLAEGPENAEGAVEAETPSKRGRGRPKGSKARRSPTPEGDLPAEERYFFQNRPGPPRVSNSTLSGLKLLTHDEYFDQLRRYEDHHDPERSNLMKLHARSFPQWRFEMSEGFNICLYGWGSKRQLVNKYAEWLYSKSTPSPKIVVVNGYTHKLSIRTVLNTIAAAAMGDVAPSRVGGQPAERLETILSYFSSNPSTHPIFIMINSVDAPSLRKPATQSLLARLAACSSIHMLATADTPSFLLRWDTSLRDRFSFVFHDCTTFAAYDVELDVVDDVHELLSRKGRRIGGNQGVEFVLKSLPENARNLYRVLLTEILAILTDGVDNEGGQGSDDEGEGEGDASARWKKGPQAEGEVGVDYKVLYQKASEEFICGNEMNFRILLKEFYDHQMIVSRKDATGTEVLGVPLGREEMEGVLEDLVGG